MTQIAKVAVAAATYAIDKPYDYLVPSGMELSVGCRVTVPFGRGNRTAEGMVLQLRQEVPAKPLKAIRNLLDQEPVLTEKEIRLALWMRQRYFCTFYDALHTILPAAVWYRYREIWSLCPTAEEEGLTEREQAVCRMLSDGPQERETLCTALGEDIPSVLYQMKKKGLVSVETETSRKVKDHMVELASLAAPAQEVLERVWSAAAGPPPGSMKLRRFWPGAARPRFMTCAISPALPARPSAVWRSRASSPSAAGRSTASPHGSTVSRRRRSP